MRERFYANARGMIEVCIGVDSALLVTKGDIDGCQEKHKGQWAENRS